jgi:hypothetical protein
MNIQEIGPIRRYFDTGKDEDILDMGYQGQNVYLIYSEENMQPYIVFQNLQNPPIIHGNHWIMENIDEKEEMSSILRRIEYSGDETTKFNYYCSGNGEIIEDNKIDEYNKFFICNDLTTTILFNKQYYTWKVNFNLQRDRKQSGEEVNFITLTGFYIYP